MAEIFGPLADTVSLEAVMYDNNNAYVCVLLSSVRDPPRFPACNLSTVVTSGGSKKLIGDCGQEYLYR